MRVTIAVTLTLCLAVSAFASGERQEVFPDKWGKGFLVEEMPEPQVYNGTFRMEEGEYPAILSDEGKLYYLMFPGMLVIPNEGVNLPPVDGAALSIEAFKTPFSPVHLMVISAKVNGEEIDLQWYDHWHDEWSGAYGGRGWKGRRGHRGYYYGPGWGGYGPWGGPGWGGYGPWCEPGWGGYGPWGEPGWDGYVPWGEPGWDYPEN